MKENFLPFLSSDFEVSLSVADTAEKLKSAFAPKHAELLDNHEIYSDGLEIVVMVFEKAFYYSRKREGSWGFTITLDNTGEHTNVHTVCSGGELIPSNNMHSKVSEALNEYIIEKE